MQQQRVKTNLFKLTPKPIDLFVHTIKTTPELKKATAYDFITRFIEKKEDARFKGYAFDGANNIILFEKINEKYEIEAGRTKFEIKIDFREQVSIDKETKKVNEAGQQALDLMMKTLRKDELIKSGRNVLVSPYCKSAKRDTLPVKIINNVEIWQGLFQSIRFLNKGIYLNVDVALGAYFQELPIIEYLGRYADSKAFSNLEQILKKVKVETLHLKKNFTFKGQRLTDLGADQLFFESDDKVKTSVAEYFSKTYFNLRNPSYPCLIRKKGDIEYYFPLEVLKVHRNQRVFGRLDEKQTSDVIRIAAKRPHERFQQIRERMELFQSVGSNNLLNIEISNQFMEVQSKVLPAPTLMFGRDEDRQVIDGGWNIGGVEAMRKVKMDYLSVLNCARLDDREIRNTMHKFIEIWKNFGIEIADENFVIKQIRNPSDFDRALSKFSFVILPDNRNSDLYKTAKTVSELHRNTITQCIKYKNFTKRNPSSIAANIALKIVIKLGGFPHKIKSNLNLFKHETIVFGADISHPGVGSDAGTLAAVVASMDRNCSSYNTYMEYLDDRQEVIFCLKNIVKKALTDFKNKNKSPPKSIIFFRDGISESQFLKSFTTEVEQIKIACQELNPNYKPKITFIICQKRHSIRFCTEKTGSYNGRPVNSNILPGTLISELSSEGYDDFYMVTHNALLGCARPVRYTKLLDENNYGDALPKFIYDMCHLFGRATKAVSIPAPVYYAHLAAARAKVYSDCKETALVDNKKEMFYL